MVGRQGNLSLRHKSNGPYDGVNGGGGNGSGKAPDENAHGRKIRDDTSTKCNVEYLNIGGVEKFNLSAKRHVGIRKDWTNRLYQGRENFWSLKAKEGFHEEEKVWLLDCLLSSGLDPSVAAYLPQLTRDIEEWKNRAK